MIHIRTRLAISIAFAVSFGPTAADAQRVHPSVFEETGIFSRDGLNESSGIAVSRSQPGILWTHNDSGDRARIYATNLSGDDLGHFRVGGSQALDWEDIALGPCPESNEEGDCLYIADTGDNDGVRRGGTIYVVAEPDVSAEASRTEGRTERPRALRVTYPDGPRNIEALAVTGYGDLLLITKGTLGPVLLYTIPAREVAGRSVRVSKVDTLPISPSRSFGSFVTAAAVSPSGQHLVVRTYTELYFFAVEPDGSWHLSGSPCWIGLRQPQGEAVDFIDEGSVVLTSESAMGKKGGVATAVCPAIGDPDDVPPNGGRNLPI